VARFGHNKVCINKRFEIFEILGNEFRNLEIFDAKKINLEISENQFSNVSITLLFILIFLFFFFFSCSVNGKVQAEIAVTPEVCAGHFDGFPAFPLSIIVRHCTNLIGIGVGRRIQVVDLAADAKQFAWAGVFAPLLLLFPSPLFSPFPCSLIGIGVDLNWCWMTKISSLFIYQQSLQEKE
jgi:hypothetical protein